MSSTYNALGAAIVQEENSQWNNNPGALENAFGQPIDFGSYQAGYNAMLQKLQYDISGQSNVYSPNMTLAQFENVYTGGDPNAAANIGSMLGVPTTTPVSQLSDQNLGTQSNSWWQNFLQSLSQGTLNNPMNPANPSASAAIQDAKKKAKSVFGITSNIAADVAAVLVGLVLIAGAVFTFSQVRDTVVSAAKIIAA